MSASSDKPIRSLRENAAGKVVSEGPYNRWEWQSEDETARLLKQLANDELAIEKTDLHPVSHTETGAADSAAPRPPLKPGARDAAGGFNPYDHAGKPRRR